MKTFLIFTFFISSNFNIWVYYLNNTLIYQKNEHYWKQTINNLDVLSFTSLKIKNGKIIYSHLTNIDFFKKSNITLVPHITFYNTNEGKRFLDSQKKWPFLINQLKTIMKQNNWNTVNFDFEYLPPHYNKKYSKFLSYFCKIAPEIKITLALFPMIDFNPEISNFHNPSTLYKYPDEIIIMCYDYHNLKTKPGPVSDINWVEKNILYYLKFFKPEQIWLGTPLYGYEWINDKFYRVITNKNLNKLKGYKFTRDISGNLYLYKKRKSKIHKIYLADKYYYNLMVNIANKYKLKGIALWRLGFENFIFEE